jgi:medium-chain acyl-[acyl-carrier-protein] hydrolase
MPSPWLKVYKRPAAVSMRLFCFHFAGGGASMYHKWADRLPRGIELIAIQLPGREWRIAEPPFRRLEPLRRDLADVLTPFLDRNYMVFGHSMGALVSFELIQELRRRGLRQPLLFMPAGRGAPQLPDEDPPIHHLPESRFIEALEPESREALQPVLRDDGLKTLVLPILRADYELCESYRYPGYPPLECPIVALGGIDDTSVEEGDLVAWKQQTTGEFRHRRLPGGHFFVRSQEALVLRSIRQELSAFIGSNETWESEHERTG